MEKRYLAQAVLVAAELRLRLKGSFDAEWECTPRAARTLSAERKPIGASLFKRAAAVLVVMKVDPQNKTLHALAIRCDEGMRPWAVRHRYEIEAHLDLKCPAWAGTTIGSPVLGKPELLIIVVRDGTEVVNTKRFFKQDAIHGSWTVEGALEGEGELVRNDHG